MARVTVVTGGIGCGKSVVCRALREKGHAVYDCDARARTIMDGSDTIRHAIGERLGDSCLNADGSLNRPEIAARVFADPESRMWLNSTVHRYVLADIQDWLDMHEAEGIVFIETAIPATSGIDLMADSIWLVSCPDEERIRRIVRRDGCSEEHALSRIRAQRDEFGRLAPGMVREIVNDGIAPLLPQIDLLLGEGLQ